MSIITRNELEAVVHALSTMCHASEQPTDLINALRKLKSAATINRTALTTDEIDRLWFEIGSAIGGTRSQFDSAIQKSGLPICDKFATAPSERDLFDEEISRHADELVEMIASGEIKTPEELGRYVVNTAQSCSYAAILSYACTAIQLQGNASARVYIHATAENICLRQLAHELRSPDRFSAMPKELQSEVLGMESRF